MREFFTIAIFKIKADIRMNKTTLNSQKEKHSMLSLRRVTSLGLLSLKPHTHFYPRSPCGERPGVLYCHLIPSKDFYPRSPCGERLILHMAHLMEHLFLSTLSLRRATTTSGQGANSRKISIHALLAESDPPSITPAPSRRNFYPRSPCGERHKGETHHEKSRIISIHALLAESDG